MWRANDILNETFDGKESEEEQCGEEALLLSKKHGILETSSGGVKKLAKKKGKENLEPENSEERVSEAKRSVCKYRRKTNKSKRIT